MISINELSLYLTIIVVCLFSFKSGYELGKERINNFYVKELKQWIEQLKKQLEEEE